MNEEQMRSRAIHEISNLRFRAGVANTVGRSDAASVMDQAYVLWMDAGGDTKDEEFINTMGRLALQAMANRQVEYAHAIIQAGYAPRRCAWEMGGRSVGGLAHCLAGMDAKGRLKTHLPDRGQVLVEALSRPDWWGEVLDIQGVHHELDALSAAETSHWLDLRGRRGMDNLALHAERVRFEQALVDAGCPVAREDTHRSLLAAAIPEFGAGEEDLRAGLEHVRRVVGWGGAGTMLARASAWTAAIRRDVHQVLVDPGRPGPRVALLDELGVAIEVPARSHVHAGVALAALQKAYIPVVDRLVEQGRGFDWLDENDMGGILAKLGGNKPEVAQAVARVPMGWLGPAPEGRVNAISVQASNCNIGLLERAIDEGWPLDDAMGQRKSPLKTMGTRVPGPSQTPQAMRKILRCLVDACNAKGIGVAVHDPIVKLAVGLRDVQSLAGLWNLVDGDKESGIDDLILACCRAPLGASPIEDDPAAAVVVFDFLYSRSDGPARGDVAAQWLRACMASRNRALFDRVLPLAGEITGPAWPEVVHQEDAARADDLGHMINAMAGKGALAPMPRAWNARPEVLEIVLAAMSRLQLACGTIPVAGGTRSLGRL